MPSKKSFCLIFETNLLEVKGEKMLHGIALTDLLQLYRQLDVHSCQLCQEVLEHERNRHQIHVPLPLERLHRYSGVGLRRLLLHRLGLADSAVFAFWTDASARVLFDAEAKAGDPLLLHSQVVVAE